MVIEQNKHTQRFISANEFGFLPGEDGEVNTEALQLAVRYGGTILVEEPGIYDLTGTILLESNTEIIFGYGTKLRRVANKEGVQEGGYFFINKGAYTREYNENIRLVGLHLLCNGFESIKKADIPGLRGQVSFFYVKNLVIENFTCLDIPKMSFCIQVCTFENLVIDHVHMEGKKDGIHLGKGSKFSIRHGLFKTYDDPIALNAHDYATSNPQLGWIEDGIIEDCYDLADDSTVGFFCRILAGAWVDWFLGMEVQHSDTVVHQERLYRVNMNPNGETYVSNTAPNHEQGTKDYDGIKWVMVQDDDLIYNCGCRNIHFKDIFLQKERKMGMSIHFDKDQYSRSFYPNAKAPVQENIIFENIVMENEIPYFIFAVTPVDTIKVLNSSIKNSRILLASHQVEGLGYGLTKILYSGNTFHGEKIENIVECEGARNAALKICSSLTGENEFYATVSKGVKVLASDVEIR